MIWFKVVLTIIFSISISQSLDNEKESVGIRLSQIIINVLLITGVWLAL